MHAHAPPSGSGFGGLGAAVLALCGPTHLARLLVSNRFNEAVELIAANGDDSMWVKLREAHVPDGKIAKVKGGGSVGCRVQMAIVGVVWASSGWSTFLMAR